MNTVMIGIMVKNSARYLPVLLEQLENLDYPKDLMRVVFIYGESKDNSLDILKEYSKRTKMKVEIYKENRDNFLRVMGIWGSGSIYKDFQDLLEEDYFLFLDSDLIFLPQSLITDLININEDIVAPFVWSENYRHFYDNYIFRIDNSRFHPFFPPGIGLDSPFEVDSVGTCFLARREVFKDTPISNPQPNLMFALNAKRKGYKIFAVPYISIIHPDLELKGIYHSPPPPEYGFQPSNVFKTTGNRVKSLEGDLVLPLEVVFSSNPIIRNFEIAALGEGMKKYCFDPDWKKKGKQWCYNYSRFQLFWKTINLDLRNAMFEEWMNPKYIEIEVTTRCNLKCRICEHSYWDEPAIDMTFEQFKSIVDQFPDLVWIGLTGIGESFLNKDFLKMLEYIKKKNVFIELYDSFFYLDKDMIKKLVDLGVDRIIASVDAATKETYEKIRKGSNYEKVWNNIVTFDRYKKEIHSGHYPELCFHYIVTKENVNEVIPYLHKLRDLDLDVSFVQFGRMLHSYPEIKNMFIEVPEEVQRKIRDEAKNLKINLSWNANIILKRPPLNYCTEIFMPFIFVNGDVITCCAMNEANRREWQHSVSLGNILKTPFKDIWNNEKYKNIRKILYEAKKFPEECQDCPLYEVSSS